MASEPSSLPEVEWTAHPARQRPLAALFAAATVLAIAAAAWWSFGIAWSVLAIVFMVASLQRFFFSSAYHINSTGISSRCMVSSKKMRWSEVRRFVHDDNGAFLSSRVRPSFMDGWSGMHLQFGDRRNEIVAAVKRHCAEAHRHSAVDAAQNATSSNDLARTVPGGLVARGQSRSVGGVAS